MELLYIICGAILAYAADGVYRSSNKMSDTQKAIACARKLAPIFKKWATKYGGNEVHFKVSDITYKNTGEDLGNIEIIWKMNTKGREKK